MSYLRGIQRAFTGVPNQAQLQLLQPILRPPVSWYYKHMGTPPPKYTRCTESRILPGQTHARSDPAFSPFESEPMCSSIIFYCCAKSPYVFIAMSPTITLTR